MNRNGSIIIIEDDLEDQSLMEQAFVELGYTNKRIYFDDGPSAIHYLQGDIPAPFLILSDINLPVMDGIELKRKLKGDAKTNLLTIPYLYFTTGLNQNIVLGAYNALAQGYFVKPVAYSELVETIRVIVEYWKRCVSPNNFLK
ncbi:response regulator [Dyadobacter luticola]|uniref:Response regulator n=1 Tax=Dyadobacter luticola TaxID=1979387 RepID=A0A5R9KVV2_9BACT|nr:response regulator [Dyadobacter luticola]TLV00298.1 response regulator [Dyadobacter luticola]